MLKGQIDSMISDFGMRLSYQGITMNKYLEYTGSTEEQMRESFRPQAEKQIKISLIIEKVAEEEGLKAPEEEVNDKIAELEKTYKKSFDELEKQGLSKTDIEREIVLGKAIDLVVNNAKMKKA